MPTCTLLLRMWGECGLSALCLNLRDPGWFPILFIQLTQSPNNLLTPFQGRGRWAWLDFHLCSGYPEAHHLNCVRPEKLFWPFILSFAFLFFLMISSHFWLWKKSSQISHKIDKNVLNAVLVCFSILTKHWLKENWERKEFLWLEEYRTSWKEARAGAEGRNMEARTEVGWRDAVHWLSLLPSLHRSPLPRGTSTHRALGPLP